MTSVYEDTMILLICTMQKVILIQLWKFVKATHIPAKHIWYKDLIAKGERLPQ